MKTGKEIVNDWNKMKQDCPADFPLEIELLIDDVIKEAYEEGYSKCEDDYKLPISDWIKNH
jgi:hypothetical protein